MAIVLKSLERFEDPNTKQSRATAFPSVQKNAHSIAPSAADLGLHAQTFKRQDLDITLAPFESYTLRPQSRKESQPVSSSTLSTKTCRITIENEDGERYRVDCNPTYTQKGSRLFMPLTPNPSASYTALYHPMKPTSHLTIHTQHLPKYARWMEALPDALPLSAISIPGTHNSHTHYRALPSVRCQIVDIATQLENGIRFLDIRVQPCHPTDVEKKDLYLVHGAFPVSLTGTKYLEPALETCYNFLEKNPSETVLISLKREGIGSATDAHLAAVLEKHYIAPHASKWYTAPSIPYLRSVRGKLVLIRRYELPTPSPSLLPPDLEEEDAEYGLDATAWPNNATHALHGSFSIQDFCEIPTPTLIPAKLHHCTAHLVRAAALTHFIPGVNTDVRNPVPPAPIYLNFLSGSNFFRVGTWPERIAKVVNRGVEEWICAGHGLRVPVMRGEEAGVVGGDVLGVRRTGDGDGAAGVVVMDMVGEGGEWDLVRLVVGLNGGVLGKGE